MKQVDIARVLNVSQTRIVSLVLLVDFSRNLERLAELKKVNGLH